METISHFGFANNIEEAKALSTTVAFARVWQRCVGRILLKLPRMSVLLAVFFAQYAGATGFVNANPMSTYRFTPTATLLFDGRILVAGGNGYNGALSSAEFYDPSSGTWRATGTMNTNRVNHTATMLPSGKVLVVGGSSSNDVVQFICELYDPASGLWTAAGGSSRAKHTATLLPNGKVLVVGGYNNTASYLSSAELYDPVSGTWTPTGPLTTARYQHTATLLADGKVLVAGGSGFGVFVYPRLASVEIYDPTSGTWTTTNSMNGPRELHTATLLPSGKVLVAGGLNYIGQLPVNLSSAELFDPVTGTWTTNSMSTSRNSHRASLLPNGRVLVVGGGSNREYSAEIYDPVSGLWASTGSQNTNRFGHIATLLPNGAAMTSGGNEVISLPDGIVGYINSPVSVLFESASGTTVATGLLSSNRNFHTSTLLPNGKVLVAGGNGNAGRLSIAEIYDPGTGMWTSRGALINARSGGAVVLMPNGKVLVAGGYGNSDRLSSVELYDPGLGTSVATGPLNSTRGDHTATSLSSGKVLVVGGSGSAGSPISTAEMYDPTIGNWTLTQAMSTNRAYHTATLLPNGKVLVVGGGWNGTGFLSSAELFDPATGIWTGTSAMNTARYFHTATLLANGKVLIVGGVGNSGRISSSELYDFTTGTWTVTGALAAARYWHTAALLSNGKVLVAGGDGNSGLLSSMELYDPSTGTWSPTSALVTARFLHTSTLLPNGKVLIAGGQNSGGILSSAELYDVGLGFNTAWQPQISSVNSSLGLGGRVTMTGTRFRGISGASGGNTQDSSSDYPLVQLRSVESGRSLFLSTTNWTTNSFVSTPITNFPTGHALVTMFVNGIPSISSIVSVGPVALPVGGRMAGELVSGDPNFGSFYYDGYLTYSLSPLPGVEYGVYARSASGFGAALKLSDSSGGMLSTNDVLPSLSEALVLFTNAPGVGYGIEVSSVESNATGGYEVALYSVVRPGQVVTNALSGSDPVKTNLPSLGNGAWFVDDYLLQGVSVGEQIQLSVDNPGFAPFLQVLYLEDGSETQDPKYTPAANYSWKVGGIPQGAPRNYLIRVTSSTSGSLGNYTLRVERGTGPEVWGFSPGSGIPGTLVRVWGTNFMEELNPVVTGVKFGGVPGNISIYPFSSGLAQELEAEVPPGGVSGPITVEINYNANNPGVSTNSFVVLGALGLVRREGLSGFSFGVSNAAGGVTNVVEATTNLSPPVLWQALTTNAVLSPSLWRYTNQNTTTFRERFFRVRVGN